MSDYSQFGDEHHLLKEIEALKRIVRSLGRRDTEGSSLSEMADEIGDLPYMATDPVTGKMRIYITPTDMYEDYGVHAHFATFDANEVPKVWVDADLGVLYGNDVVLTGRLSAGATAVLTGNGYWLDTNGGTPVARIGTVSAGTLSKGFYWDGSNFQLKSDSMMIDSAAPKITLGVASDYMTGAGIFAGKHSGTYKFHVGDPAAKNLAWDGSVLAANGQWIRQAGMNPSLQSWTTNIVFSSASDVQVNWTSGTITLGASGTTYSISSGNTSTMAALTYIYLDIAVSTTVLQKTTTYSTAVGDGKILIAAAQNATAGASVIPYGGQQPIVNGTQITALSILAGNIAAGAVTASKISVSSLAAVSATMGVLTVDTTLTFGASGNIRMGATGPSTGSGTYVDVNGFYCVLSSVQQATLTSTGVSAAAGKIVLDSSGASAITTTSPSDDRAYRFKTGSTTTGGLYGWTSGSTETYIDVRALSLSGRDTFLRLQSDAPSGRAAEISFEAQASGSTLTQLTLTSPGGFAFSGNSIYLNGAGGVNSSLYIGDNANANMTIGITINQGGADDNILEFKSSDVAHGVTTVTETDTWGFWGKQNAAGGLVMTSINTGNAIGMILNAIVTNPNAAKSTAANANLILSAKAISGTGVANLAANENIIAFRNNATTRFILDGDGDSHQDVGTAWTNFHGHKDNDLLQLLSAHVSSITDPLRENFGAFLSQNRKKLEDLKLATFNDDGHHFVNMSRLTMLLVGAVIQANARIDTLEQRLLTSQ